MVCFVDLLIDKLLTSQPTVKIKVILLSVILQNRLSKKLCDKAAFNQSIYYNSSPFDMG